MPVISHITFFSFVRIFKFYSLGRFRLYDTASENLQFLMRSLVMVEGLGPQVEIPGPSSSSDFLSPRTHARLPLHHTLSFPTITSALSMADNWLRLIKSFSRALPPKATYTLVARPLWGHLTCYRAWASSQLTLKPD